MEMNVSYDNQEQHNNQEDNGFQKEDIFAFIVMPFLFTIALMLMSTISLSIVSLFYTFVMKEGVPNFNGTEFFKFYGILFIILSFISFFFRKSYTSERAGGILIFIFYTLSTSNIWIFYKTGLVFGFSLVGNIVSCIVLILISFIVFVIAAGPPIRNLIMINILIFLSIVSYILLF